MLMTDEVADHKSHVNVTDGRTSSLSFGQLFLAISRVVGTSIVLVAASALVTCPRLCWLVGHPMTLQSLSCRLIATELEQSDKKGERLTRRNVL